MIQLDGESVSIHQIKEVSQGAKVFKKVEFSEKARERVRRSKSYIDDRLKKGDVIYGVNTGFGSFSSVKISEENIFKLQRNLIRSHSTGVGNPFSLEETRAILFLRANALARGHSGIREEVIEKLLELLNLDLLPVIPSQGSVGASGDLAPLSHLALALIGEGEIWEDGEARPAIDVLKKNGVTPLELKAKEGLALINGCQVMTAVGALAAIRAKELLCVADMAGAMSLEGLRGSRSPFNPLVPATRPHVGEIKTAKNLLKILGSSEIGNSHENCERVQDPYSLRCMPAVHGAVRDTLERAISVLETEANSSTDNPLVFDKENEILSCGNFHGEPVAFQLDFLAIAITTLSSISECRTEKLINPAMSGLPAFLAQDGGLNSGMMIVQVSAASIVSENKILSHPASVDSIPTSADKEDHVSMGTTAARKLRKIVSNSEKVLAMEILAAKQALGLLKPLEPAAGVKAIYDYLDDKVPFASEDRVFSKDINLIHKMIQSGELTKVLFKAVGPLE